MKKDYEKLTSEIDKFIVLLDYMEKKIIGLDEKYDSFNIDIVDKDKTEAIFKSMKANVVIMLYNLVESTVRGMMNIYYDSFNSKKLSYSESIEEIRKLWVKYASKKFKDNKVHQQAFQLIEDSINSEYYLSLEFDKDFSLDGNVDLRKIREVLDTHGIKYEEQSFNGSGQALKSIKDMRNSLSHGNISFEDSGKTLGVSDIVSYKEQTYSCLNYFMDIVQSKIEEEWGTNISNS